MSVIGQVGSKRKFLRNCKVCFFQACRLVEGHLVARISSFSGLNIVKDAPKTRISLILRLSESADAEAWQQFADIYQPLIYKIARLGRLQPNDANDFVQDVLVRVARSVDHWDPDPQLGSFRGWLSKVARNLLIDFLRRQSRLPTTSGNSDVLSLIDQFPDRSAESELYDAELQKQIFLWATDQVKPSFRQTTWRAFWETTVMQRSVAEVADELKISVGAIYVARSRIIARLRKTIESSEINSSEFLRTAE